MRVKDRRRRLIRKDRLTVFRELVILALLEAVLSRARPPCVRVCVTVVAVDDVDDEVVVGERQFRSKESK